MTGRQVVNSWKAWLESAEGKKCTSGSADGKYLENRLWWAYMAGMAAEYHEDSSEVKP